MRAPHRPGTSIDRLYASATTPDGAVSASITDRVHVQVRLLPGYYDQATATDLERQLSRLGRLLFAARMKEYYKVRSQDFGELVTREPSPLGRQDEEYVDRRSRLVATGEAADGRVRISVVGMEQWAVEIAQDAPRTMSEESFCKAVSDAATLLVTEQFAEVRMLKREVYGGMESSTG